MVWCGMVWYVIMFLYQYGIMVWYDTIVWCHAMVSWYGMGGHNGGN